ncbi:MAG: AMP-dependent synthetase [Micrococcales bacterium]|nr:MAG: AMP-dependent synthetase [Micrococcales bacterium]
MSAQPDAVAVTDDRSTVTYRSLAGQAAGVLSQLRRVTTGVGDTASPEWIHGKQPVGVLLGHHAGAVAAIVAVLASGHPMLVLDVRSPTARQRQLLDTVGVRLIVTDEQHVRVARTLCPHVVLTAPDTQADPELLFADPPDPRQLAVIAFTSGSTGTPKPVANDSRLLIRDAWNSSTATGCYGHGDVIAHTLPMAFHAGLTTTVHGLLVGAQMRLYDARAHGIAGLPEVIAAHRCTMMITSPAILRAFVAEGPDPAKLASLRTVTVAGEAAYGSDIAAVRALLPAACTVRNRYGSSETGLIAEFALAPGAPVPDGVLPVGTGVGRTRLSVVREDGTPVPAGEIGRLVVHAPDVAMGYPGMPEATAAAFSHQAEESTYRTSDLGRVLPSGCVQLMGRVDHATKVRGYLVNPAEVDAALFALPDIAEAVVVAAEHPRESRTRLVAYIVASDPTETDETVIARTRAALRTMLPIHMVPEAIICLERLPRSERGKIDRAALPDVQEPDTTGPLTVWEEQISGEWSKVLDLDRMPGRDDDFFALGGDSLAAEALMSRLTDSLGISPQVAKTGLLAQAPTLSEFAARINPAAGREGRHSDRRMVELITQGAADPIFFVAGAAGLGVAFMALARRLGPDQPCYAFQNNVVEGTGLPDRSVQRTATRNLTRLRRVQPQGPYRLAGYSFGALVALEMAHRLRADGQDVQLAILDSFPPDPRRQPDNLNRHGFRRLTWHIRITTEPRGRAGPCSWSPKGRKAANGSAGMTTFPAVTRSCGSIVNTTICCASRGWTGSPTFSPASSTFRDGPVPGGTTRRDPSTGNTRQTPRSRPGCGQPRLLSTSRHPPPHQARSRGGCTSLAVPRPTRPQTNVSIGDGSRPTRRICLNTNRTKI